MIERDKEYYNKKISDLYAVIENQEKIIRDLQEEVKGYQTMYFDKVMIINKAIEYINNNIQEGYSEVYETEMRWDAVSGDELLEILKGKE